MMRLLPPGLLGLVFAALVAAIIASTASKINSIATIFTLDLYAKFRGDRTRAEDDRARARRGTAPRAGRPRSPRSSRSSSRSSSPGRCSASSDQAFQFIQEFTGFFTPGITVIFLLGLFWKRATEAGAIAAAVASVDAQLHLLVSRAIWRQQRAQRGPVHAPDGDRVRRVAPVRHHLFTGLQGTRRREPDHAWTA